MTLTLCPKCRDEGKTSTIKIMDGGFGCKTHGLTTVAELSSSRAESVIVAPGQRQQTQPHIGMAKEAKW